MEEGGFIFMPWDVKRGRDSGICDLRCPARSGCSNGVALPNAAAWRYLESIPQIEPTPPAPTECRANVQQKGPQPTLLPTWMLDFSAGSVIALEGKGLRKKQKGVSECVWRAKHGIRLQLTVCNSQLRQAKTCPVCCGFHAMRRVRRAPCKFSASGHPMIERPGSEPGSRLERSRLHEVCEEGQELCLVANTNFYQYLILSH